MYRSIFLLLYMGLSIESASALQSSVTEGSSFEGLEFELAKKADAIEVYTKKHPKKGFIEYRAHVVLNESSIQNMLDFFADYSQHPLWVYNCTVSRGIKKGGDAYLYQVCRSPWPYKDRDLSLSVRTEWSGENRAMVHFSSSPNTFKRSKKQVRIDDFESTWKVEKVGEKIKVTVQARFNPKLTAGGLFLGSYAVKIPFETLKKLRQCYKAKN